MLCAYSPQRQPDVHEKCSVILAIDWVMQRRTHSRFVFQVRG